MGKIVEILFEIRDTYSLAELLVIIVPLMFLLFILLMLLYGAWSGNISTESGRNNIMFLPFPILSLIHI